MKYLGFLTVCCAVSLGVALMHPEPDHVLSAEARLPSCPGAEKCPGPGKCKDVLCVNECCKDRCKISETAKTVIRQPIPETKRLSEYEAVYNQYQAGGLPLVIVPRGWLVVEAPEGTEFKAPMTYPARATQGGSKSVECAPKG